MDDSCGHSRVAFILIPEEMKWPLSCISIIKRCFLLPTDMLACIPVNKLLWVSAVKQGYLYYSDTLQVKENTRENPRIYTLCKDRSKKNRHWFSRESFLMSTTIGYGPNLIRNYGNWSCFLNRILR